MNGKNVHIWIWIQNNRVLKAVLDMDIGILKIFDEFDQLIMKRTGLNIKQVREVEKSIIRYGAKRLDFHARPFRFL